MRSAVPECSAALLVVHSAEAGGRPGVGHFPVGGPHLADQALARVVDVSELGVHMEPGAGSRGLGAGEPGVREPGR